MVFGWDRGATALTLRLTSYGGLTKLRSSGCGGALPEFLAFSLPLSLSGKAIIINALALSRVWYMASLVPVPPWVLSELNTLVFSSFSGPVKGTWLLARFCITLQIVMVSPLSRLNLKFILFWLSGSGGHWPVPMVWVSL